MMNTHVPYPFSVPRRAVTLVVLALVVGAWVWHVATPAAGHKARRAAPGHTGSDCPNTGTPNESRSVEGYNHFDIPAGEFQETIDCFMRQSGLGVGWDGNLAPQKIETRAIRNKTMRSRDALAWMLSVTPLEVLPSTDAHDRAVWLVRRTDR